HDQRACLCEQARSAKVVGCTTGKSPGSGIDHTTVTGMGAVVGAGRLMGCEDGAGRQVLYSTIAYHGQRGVRAVNSPGIIRVTHSTITGNSQGFLTNSGGVIESFGDNTLRGNSVDGTPTTTVLLQ